MGGEFYTYFHSFVIVSCMVFYKQVKIALKTKII